MSLYNRRTTVAGWVLWKADSKTEYSLCRMFITDDSWTTPVEGSQQGCKLNSFIWLHWVAVELEWSLECLLLVWNGWGFLPSLWSVIPCGPPPSTTKVWPWMRQLSAVGAIPEGAASGGCLLITHPTAGATSPSLKQDLGNVIMSTTSWIINKTRDSHPPPSQLITLGIFDVSFQTFSYVSLYWFLCVCVCVCERVSGIRP